MDLDVATSQPGKRLAALYKAGHWPTLTIKPPDTPAPKLVLNRSAHIEAERLGLGKPVHIERKIVNLPQMEQGGDFVCFEHRKKVVRSPLYEPFIEDWLEGFVLPGGHPADFCRPMTDPDYRVKNLCPSAPDELLVHGAEVSLSNLGG